MKKYELLHGAFEYRFGTSKDSIPTMTDWEVADLFLNSENRSDELIEVFDTKEEALAAWEGYKHMALTRPQASNVFWLLVGDVYFVEECEYDEDGEYDQGGDLVIYAAESYTNEG